jgi:hypothetical protein
LDTLNDAYRVAQCMYLHTLPPVNRPAIESVETRRQSRFGGPPILQDCWLGGFVMQRSIGEMDYVEESILCSKLRRDSVQVDSPESIWKRKPPVP